MRSQKSTRHNNNRLQMNESTGSLNKIKQKTFFKLGLTHQILNLD